MTASAEPSHRANSFDQLRLFAALLVLSGHSYPLTGLESPTFLGRSLHGLGLEIFFAISGYLIAESLARDRHPLRFLAKRALRILPALWAATLILVLFGLCVTTLSPVDYITNPTTLSFLKNAALDIHYALPGVFEASTVGSAMNGSWWSLPYEVLLYLVLLACVIVGRRFGVAILVVAYVGLIVARSGTAEPFNAISGLFVAGAAISSLKNWLRPSPFAAVACLLVAFLLQNEHQGWYLPVLLAYCVVSFGLQHDRAPWLSRTLGDPSYGTYLYAFAVQQTIVWMFSGIPAVALTLLATPVALLLGVMSWRLVERPALSFKPSAAHGVGQASSA